MDISQNHAHYDASSHTLTITTYYDQKAYFDKHFKRIILHGRPTTKNESPEILFSPGFLKAVCLVFAVIALLQFSIALQSGRTSYNYLFAALLWVAISLSVKKLFLWLCTATLLPLVQHTPFGQLVTIVRCAFAKQPLHQQTVVITKSSVSPDSIFFSENQDKPIMHENQFIYFQTLPNSIYLITFFPLLIDGQVKDYGKIMSQSYYFDRGMYSEHDWSVITAAFKDLGYSSEMTISKDSPPLIH